MFASSKVELFRERRLRLPARADSLIGSLLCAAGAGLASLVAAGYSWRAFVPLMFTCVLLLIALFFGARAGIIGTVLAAAIFTAFLFRPPGRVGLMDEAARANLGWMLLIGIGFSFLFAPSTSGFRRQ